jgi:SAM-dependent methyltransferase
LAEEEARSRLWERRLELLLPMMRPGSLLDVGAGIGQFLNIAKPHFTSVSGTEVSESAIQIAHQKYGLNLMRGEIQAIDFGQAQFDNVTVFHVLEHVPNPKLLIEACARLLRPRGVLVVAVPNDLSSLRALKHRLLLTLRVRKCQNTGKLGLPKLVLDGSVPEIHLSHFNPASLARLFASCRLRTVANTLDPYYVATGPAEWKERCLYRFCLTLQSVF